MIRVTTILFSIFFFLTSELAFSQELKFERSDGGVLLLDNERPRFFYQSEVKSKEGNYPRANYIHPLYGPDGEILTEDFPEDHLHHRGIFWSWHQLYADGKRIADPWLIENTSWDVENISTNVKEDTAKLKAKVFWIHTTTQRAIIKEDVEIVYKNLEEGIYSLTFSITLTALVDGVAIGGSEDEKGYGGFSSRFSLPEDVTFHSSTGKVEPQNLPVQAGSWVELKGTSNKAETAKSSIVIMGEPKKLPLYQGWILRKTKSMQNMAFPGKESIKIKKGEGISFRNQLLVHRNLSTEEIENYYKEFRSR